MLMEEYDLNGDRKIEYQDYVSLSKDLGFGIKYIYEGGDGW